MQQSALHLGEVSHIKGTIYAAVPPRDELPVLSNAAFVLPRGTIGTWHTCANRHTNKHPLFVAVC